MAEYTIDELARVAGTSVRNVRSYQSKRLLPPPRKVGRRNVYSDVHRARLQLITRLLARGFTLANIAEVLATFESGGGMPELLGLEEALTSPFSTEIPDVVTYLDLARMFGTFKPGSLQRALSLGLLRKHGTKFVVPSPRLLQVAVELTQAGIALDVLLDQVAALRRDIERVAQRFVRLIATEVFDPYGDAIPPKKEQRRLADFVTRVRPMAKVAVEVEMARALDDLVQQELGARLARIVGSHRPESANDR